MELKVNKNTRVQTEELVQAEEVEGLKINTQKGLFLQGRFQELGALSCRLL
jgi:hypothetical protein